MTLSQKQQAFTRAIVDLISYGHSLGYGFTLGDAFRADTCTHGHKNSTHRVRLALDLNLFIDGVYITDGNHEAWYLLHDYWDLIGGSQRISEDMNHFSFSHNGVR